LKGIALEIGSLDVNGALTPIFKDFTYVGLDMRIGRNVNINARGDSLPFNDRSCSCVVCCDTMEHDDNFFETTREMKRVLAPGGVIIIAVPGIGFKKHEHPHDYWRFTKEAVGVLFRGCKNIELHELGQAVYGRGFK